MNRLLINKMMKDVLKDEHVIIVDPKFERDDSSRKIILTKNNIDVLLEKLKQYPDKGPGTCRVCGCTWQHACSDNRGICWWINKDHNLCSHCFGDLMKVDILSEIELGGEEK